MRPEFLVVLLDGTRSCGSQWLVMGRYQVICCALEYRDVLCLFGNQRDSLATGRSRANDSNPFTGKVHRALRPLARVINIAAE